jgi:hypothetical protein
VPHLIRPRLIVGSYTIGKGTAEDRCRAIETLSFADGQLLAQRDPLADTVEISKEAFARLMRTGKEKS